MKIKKVWLHRPEIEVQCDMPIFARFYLACVFYRFIKIKRMKLNINISSKIMKNAGHVCLEKVWHIAIPKFKFVDSKGDKE